MTLMLRFTALLLVKFVLSKLNVWQFCEGVQVLINFGYEIFVLHSEGSALYSSRSVCTREYGN